MGYHSLNSLQANTKAIETAFKIRKEQRKATVEECAVLQGYTGFGGIPDILSLDSDDSTSAAVNQKFNVVLQQLKKVLLNGVNNDLKLYKQLVKSIKSSSLTAFYTPKSLIDSLSHHIQQTFQENNLPIRSFLEPSAGVGGFLPIASAETEKVAFEKDHVTGLRVQENYE